MNKTKKSATVIANDINPSMARDRCGALGTHSDAIESAT